MYGNKGVCVVAGIRINEAKPCYVGNAGDEKVLVVFCENTARILFWGAKGTERDRR